MPDEPDLPASLRTGCQWLAEGLTDIATALERANHGGSLHDVALALHRIGAALERRAAAAEREVAVREAELALRERGAEERRERQEGKEK